MSPTVLITGASKGIGLAAAESILADGAEVIALQRTVTPALEALSAKYPGTLKIVKGDHRTFSSSAKDVSSAIALADTLDGVVLNAALNLPYGAIATIPLDGYRGIFEVNLFSVVQFLQLALPKLRKVKGKVILVSSAAGEYGMKGIGAYAASKAALTQLNRTLAVEESDITTIAFNPGAVRTEFAASVEREGKGHVDPALVDPFISSLIEPDIPGRGIRNLVLHAEVDYTGKYLSYDDPLVTSL
ncbi:NAD(P)-binding protein [Exidia glandulosa HHB12029]|uniref:NAD(P)-binding protein n=1 Tax=Exidia glandulosa HHB12029 TaxID=1314781 RepID=A0A165DI21_EXIGL|nr:NAD(P)-binding protein [Exidia glandulosa HHB12029]